MKNRCLNCIEKGWYNSETKICTYSDCDECNLDPQKCDGVCNLQECVWGDDVFPEKWNPEVRMEFFTTDGNKIVKLIDINNQSKENKNEKVI